MVEGTDDVKVSHVVGSQNTDAKDEWEVQTQGELSSKRVSECLTLQR